MKILLVSHTDGFGAGRAALRLMRALRHRGVDATMLVVTKTSDDPHVRSVLGRWAQIVNAVYSRIDKLPFLLCRTRPVGVWSLAWFPFPFLLRAIRKIKPDLVHLHWTGFSLTPTQVKRIGVPVVWTLHDMAPFTGGCHYDNECGRYTDGCGECPQLGSRRRFDISRWILRQKKRAWHNLPLTIVSPSHWLAECARRSVVFGDKRIEVIQNPLDLDAYKPRDKAFCRDLLGLPQGKRLILFGAISATSDPRKGFDLLQAATKHLSTLPEGRDAMAVVFGAREPDNPPDLGIPVQYLGNVSDDATLAALYAAADVMVAPSRQENLANTVVEALACGTPVVAFDIGGMPDMIKHCENGYLAKPSSTQDLAGGIAEHLASPSCRSEQSDRSTPSIPPAPEYDGLYKTLV